MSLNQKLKSKLSNDKRWQWYDSNMLVFEVVKSNFKFSNKLKAFKSWDLITRDSMRRNRDDLTWLLVRSSFDKDSQVPSSPHLHQLNAVIMTSFANWMRRAILSRKSTKKGIRERQQMFYRFLLGQQLKKMVKGTSSIEGTVRLFVP